MSPYNAEIRNVYGSLGGTAFPSLESGEIVVRPGNGYYDIEIDNIALEIDEERHANHDRLVTFGSIIYDGQVWVETFKEYCAIHENECFKAASYGRNWSTPNSHRQFTPPLLEGDVSFSPRWKQRAFYDWLKDLSPHVVEMRLARISIYDRLIIAGKEYTVGKILSDNRVEAAMELRHLIDSRIMA